jgi:cis-3-alkyl-4-acyloxetan-2-one decarboxylase
MNVDGTEVHVEGDGAESIVMVHGWPDSYRLWDAQVEALRGRWRCIRFTLPGFEPGHRRQAFPLDHVVETIRRVVEQTCPGGQVTLLLHDWGCLFGYQFALRYPQLVKRVIGVDVGDAGSRPHRASLGLSAKAMIEGYQLWLAAAWRIGGRLGDRMARATAHAGRCPTDPASIHAQMGYPYWLAWTGGYRAAKRFDPACPMLFIYGRRKPFTFHSPDWADDLAQKPGCRVLGLDCGHWVMVAKPQEFNRAVADWMAAVN